MKRYFIQWKYKDSSKELDGGTTLEDRAEAERLKAHIASDPNLTLVEYREVG